MSKPENYGNYYWCIRLNEKEEVYAFADIVNNVNGTLLLLRDEKDEKTGESKVTVNLAFAPGHWERIYAASLIDGGPVAVEHWILDGKPVAKIGFSENG